MTDNNHSNKKKSQKKSKKLFLIMTIEIILILILLVVFRVYTVYYANPNKAKDTIGDNVGTDNPNNQNPDGEEIGDDGLEKSGGLSPKELEVKAEQERLKKELKERTDLIALADQLTLGYDYEGAIDLIKEYQGTEGGYQVYTDLAKAIERLEQEQTELLLYGGSYHSITEINHIFFHTLVADNSLAFDGDGEAKGYNKYMTTISEFEKILQSMYDQGYVLINMSDVYKQITLEDGTTQYVANEIYLREGKKPFVISVDDVSYYDYMEGDGFATRIIIGEDGKPTCEMILSDHSVATGAYDIVPILDAFVEQHPDFSYKGAKGLIALTGYNGILGYRTNDLASPTYDEEVTAVKKVVETMKAEGWEFGCHSWGHKNMQTSDIGLIKRDTKRWLEEVAPLIGPTEVYVFPFGIDIETTIGTYSNEKYQFLKESGFNVFLGVYKGPWMHIKKDYVRMTRRPLDGQALLEFPDRVSDLFKAEDIIDPQRPAKDW